LAIFLPQFDKIRHTGCDILMAGGDFMYYELTEEEIKDFAAKYLPEWEDDIIHVSRISYNGVVEYMVNHHYLIVIYKNAVIAKDLQEL